SNVAAVAPQDNARPIAEASAVFPICFMYSPFRMLCISLDHLIVFGAPQFSDLYHVHLNYIN
ncbi:MAG: hypothetical protein KKB38_19325, partial [Gammaproteobacteria bacterium]|nr:hypothetical protein [Gammaproteobacteria bacterium]MBU2059871.1 hypothetical protein [Gammaproteobacteria bacterium]MBU2681792.1 hypothetical protein [Gammaproteobacteria bacterium]